MSESRFHSPLYSQSSFVFRRSFRELNIVCQIPAKRNRAKILTEFEFLLLFPFFLSFFLEKEENLFEKELVIINKWCS